MAQEYSDRAVQLAFELTVKVTENLVNEYGYTVWSDVATHRVHWERPEPLPPKPSAWKRFMDVLVSKP